MSFSSFVHWLRQHRLRRWEWALLAIAGLVLLLLILLPGFLRRAITARLAAVTTAEVHLSNVDFNPFRGRLALQGLTLTLKDEDKPVIALRELVANLRMLSLLRGQVSLEEVELSGLQVMASQSANGQLNLTRLFPPSPPSATPAPESDLPTLRVEHLSLSAAQIDYQDRARTPSSHASLMLKDFTVADVRLQAQGFSSPITAHFNGSLEEGPVHGEMQLFWQRRQTVVEANIEAQRLALKAIEPYVRETLALQHLSGFSSARLHYRYHTGGDQPPVHALDGVLKLEQVSFADPLTNQTALDLPSGQVTVESIDLLSHEIRLATAELHAPRLFFLQSAAGLNWTGLVRAADPTARTETPQPKAAPAWRFWLREVRLAGGEIVYRDNAWTENETITLIPDELQIQRVGDESAESPLRFRLRLGEGTVTGEGSLRLTPLHLQTQLQLAGIDLANLRPVLTRALTTENMSGTVNGTLKAELTTHEETHVLTVSGAVDTTALLLAGIPQLGSALSWDSGHLELGEGSTLLPLNIGLTTQLSRLSVQHLAQGDVSIEKASGNLQIAQEEGTSSAVSLPETSLVVQPERSLKAQGTLDISNLLLSYGPEKQELLSCYQVRATLNAGSRLLPLNLRLGEVALEYPYAQGFRTAQGQFQLFTLSAEAPPSPAPSANLPPAEAPPAQPPPAAPSPAVHIDRVTLTGGQLYFEDHAVAPTQMVYWQDVKIDLSEVGYPLVRPAAFTLHAFNNDGAPIEMQGTTQRQADLLLTRIHGKVEHLFLPRFNAYFESFLGYQVRNGAVSLTWDLTIPGNRLQATTAVTLHNLGLSSKRSTSILEEQVGLPMQLVIALLKDLSGNINLQLPVEGQFGDPGFHVGGAIFQAIRDVLIGAVTAPLKLLGAVFSGGDKIEDFTLDPIRFVPGTSQPDSAGKEQLARLGRFLAQRPELDLHLSGHTGPDDLQILKDRVVLAQLLQESASPAKAQAAGGTESEGTPPSTSPQEEVRQFLASQLDPAEGHGTPALSAQATAVLAQLRDQVTVSQQARDHLAQDRLQAVITSLAANPGVTQGRLHTSPEKLRSREGAEVRYIVQARAEREGG
ncbi:MAG: DUF748 domain-containing protein [Deltaproteobacteria bacterium]|nr:DUF748 domain-containing protein [Deltaproteobacteria bacterium]